MSAASAATSKSLPTAAAVIQQQQPKQSSSASASAGENCLFTFSSGLFTSYITPAASSSSNPQSTTIQLKDAPAGMKMIPAGATATAAARILPKGPLSHDVRTILSLTPLSATTTLNTGWSTRLNSWVAVT